MRFATLFTVLAVGLTSASAWAQSSQPAGLVAPQYWPQTITGKVSVTRVRCPGCPPIVRVGDTEIDGSLVDDLAAFEQQTVTVNGPVKQVPAHLSGDPQDLMYAEHFTPGKPPAGQDFITGTVEIVRAADGGPEHLGIKGVSGQFIPLVDFPNADKLKEAEGAELTLYGEKQPLPDYHNGPIGGPPRFQFKPISTTLVAKGQAHTLYHILNDPPSAQPLVYLPGHEWPTYSLKIPDADKSFMIYGGDPNIGGDGSTHWVTLSLDGDKLRVKGASKAVFPTTDVIPFPGPPVLPQPVADAQGDNSSRFDTPTGESSDAAAEQQAAQGQGMRRARN